MLFLFDAYYLDLSKFGIHIDTLILIIDWYWALKFLVIVLDDYALISNTLVGIEELIYIAILRIIFEIIGTQGI